MKKSIINILSYIFYFYYRIKYSIFWIHVINNVLQNENFFNIFLLKKFWAKVWKWTVIKTLIIQNAEKDYSNLYVWSNCHLWKWVFLDLADKITIEDNVTISMLVKIITHIHLWECELSNYYKKEYDEVYIKNNVYIWVNSTLLKWVIVDSLNFIWANSLVNKSIKWSLWVYFWNPAKFIKKL